MEKKVGNKYIAIYDGRRRYLKWDILKLHYDDWSEFPFFINLRTWKQTSCFWTSLKPYTPTLPKYRYIENDWSELAMKCRNRVCKKGGFSNVNYQKYYWYDNWIGSNWYIARDQHEFKNNPTKITLEQLWEYIESEQQEAKTDELKDIDVPKSKYPQRVLDLAMEEYNIKPNSNAGSDFIEWHGFTWDTSRQWYYARKEAYNQKNYTLLQERVDKNKTNIEDEWHMPWDDEYYTVKKENGTINLYWKWIHEILKEKWIDLQQPLTPSPIKKMSVLQTLRNKTFFTEKRATETNKVLDKANELMEWLESTVKRADEARYKIGVLKNTIEIAFENNDINAYKINTEKLLDVIEFIEKDPEAKTLTQLGKKEAKKVEKYDSSI